MDVPKEKVLTSAGSMVCLPGWPCDSKAEQAWTARHLSSLSLSLSSGLERPERTCFQYLQWGLIPDSIQPMLNARLPRCRLLFGTEHKFSQLAGMSEHCGVGGFKLGNLARWEF